VKEGALNQTLFDGIPSELKTAIHIGVEVTENIKTFVDSPAADIFIPGNIDDEVKSWLRAKLPAILTELKLADNCGQLTDPAEITKCAARMLQSLDKNILSPRFTDLPSW
jgi:hypothetical protein